MDCKHIVGPPGCGKTHACMEHIEAFLQNRIPADEIAFVSFTKAAVNEARKRVQERFGIAKDDIPYFGTIHSMAYRSIGLNKDQVFGYTEWADFCKEIHLDYTPYDGKDDDLAVDFPGMREGDVFRRFHDWRRNCLLDLDEGFAKFYKKSSFISEKTRTKWLSDKIEEYKNDNNLYDFTDMLVELLESGWYPPVKVLIVDETQDLSPLQRKIVFRNWEAINNFLLAYDGDQCIYDFQGADPKWLLGMEGEREFLSQSYRVPLYPSQVSQRIISQNRERYNITWKHREGRGEVKFNVNLDQVIKLCAETPDETWYFLGRNRMYLSSFVNRLMDAGIPFTNLRGFSPRVTISALASLKLSLGVSITLYELDHIADETPQKEWWVRGAKSKIDGLAKERPDEKIDLTGIQNLGGLPQLTEALSKPETSLSPLKGDDDKKEYYLRIYQRYGIDKLIESPNVTISTIHGVKGGEAKNVVIDPRMTRQSYNGYLDDPEPENRIWYVGSSRTENRLFVTESYSQSAYTSW